MTAKNLTFLPVPDKPSFPEEEEKVLKFWEDIKAFETSLELSKDNPPYSFYDGPPFATGLPHYGHILAGTIKDVVCRYAHQKGFHVPRRFGWDCHGLPAEHATDKALGIKTKEDMEKIGIAKYNEECRKTVLTYASEWRSIIGRFGRWIDFDNDYKTMDVKFMESVWWVFKQLFEKGLVYKSFRVMPYSTACHTPIANFEVQQNYKDVADPSIVVRFKIVDDKDDASFLVWTTTPWTLPSNLAVCAHPTLEYVRVRAKEGPWKGHVFICGKDRLQWCGEKMGIKAKNQKKDLEILETVKGAQLKGLQYQPPFDYFVGKVFPGAHSVVLGEYVSTAAGTCLVHQAPAFGEEDFQVCLAHKIIEKDGTGLPNPVDDSGLYTEEVWDYQGRHVKDADKDLIAALKEKGLMVNSSSEVHSYPHCPRSDTPLIYKAVSTWFIKVEDSREKLLKNNERANWVPKHVQEKRFHNWLAEAKDWLVSRNRYWGNPIPLWVNEDLSEIKCVGSLQELEELSGVRVEDLHRHHIDHILIPSEKNPGKMLKRIDEVFDCWFESGSMPYAQLHYPFENQDVFERTFPANFCAEGLDQTRGWFYTLNVLSSLLFDREPFQNLVVNGLVLASDGKKMSKRLKNYPDPVEVVDKHGADAVRMYLCNSPVVRAESLKFREEGVRDVVKDVFLPYFNAYRFLVQEVARFEGASGEKFQPSSSLTVSSENPMDKWIYAACQSLIAHVRKELDAYRLYTVAGELIKFLDNLTNWYVRMNRDRMRGQNESAPLENARVSLNTLYTVLLDLTIVMAPVTPFLAEMVYQNLSRALPEGHDRKAQSVHFVMIPTPDLLHADANIERTVAALQQVIVLGRNAREKRKVGVKTPVLGLKVINESEQFKADVSSLADYAKEELNVESLEITTDTEDVETSVTLNFRALGAKVGKQMKNVQAAVQQLSPAQITSFLRTGAINVLGFELSSDELVVSRKVGGSLPAHLETGADATGSTLILMDFTEDQRLLERAMARELATQIQKLKKSSGLKQEDAVSLCYLPVDPASAISSVLSQEETKGYIQKMLRGPLTALPALPHSPQVVVQEKVDVEGFGCPVEVVIMRSEGQKIAA